MDRFWIIPGPFWTIVPANGLVDMWIIFWKLNCWNLDHFL